MNKNKSGEISPNRDERDIIKKAKRFVRFESACMLDLTVEHNGEVSGDAGGGGFVNLKLEFDAFAIDVDFKKMGKVEKIGDLESMTISLFGEYERKTFISALKVIVDELETPIKEKR